MNDFSKLEKKLAVEFKDKNLLAQAFCHRSYLNENPEFKMSHNERLEFLGDAVLELIVTKYLFGKYPNKSEGELTNWRAALVNSKILAETAKELGFNDFLLLSRGEHGENGKARLYILGDALEAFIGALFLDQGLSVCAEFAKKYLLVKLSGIVEQGAFRDPKSYFQEQAQEKLRITPAYKVLDEWGPDHDKHFLVGVFLEEEMVAQGEDSSKQDAEEKAAEKALETKNW